MTVFVLPLFMPIDYDHVYLEQKALLLRHAYLVKSFGDFMTHYRQRDGTSGGVNPNYYVIS